MFDDRIAEDVKLSSGAFVSVGPLRARVIAAGDPCVHDAVVADINIGVSLPLTGPGGLGLGHSDEELPRAVPRQNCR